MAVVTVFLAILVAAVIAQKPYVRIRGRFRHGEFDIETNDHPKRFIGD